MDQAKFKSLVKEYLTDCCDLSFLKRNHPALVKILAEGPRVIPWALEYFKDSIGHDMCKTVDMAYHPYCGNFKQ